MLEIAFECFLNVLKLFTDTITKTRKYFFLSFWNEILEKVIAFLQEECTTKLTSANTSCN